MNTPRRGPGERLSATARLRAQIGLSPSALRRLDLPADAWTRWDKKHGTAFRLAHGIGLPRDLARLEAGEVDLGGDLPDPPGLNPGER